MEKRLQRERSPQSVCRQYTYHRFRGHAGLHDQRQYAIQYRHLQRFHKCKSGDDLTINGGAIRSATGDINVNAGGDLNLNFANGFLGAIPRRENPLPHSTKYWTYGNGGNITIHVSGNVGSVNGSIAIANTSGNINNGWDSNNSSGGWSANYLANATEGLATMAGGNLTVFAGGSFLCQAGTFAGVSSTGVFANNSGGNLTIFSGGDMEGRFLIGGVDHFRGTDLHGQFQRRHDESSHRDVRRHSQRDSPGPNRSWSNCQSHHISTHNYSPCW